MARANLSCLCYCAVYIGLVYSVSPAISPVLLRRLLTLMHYYQILYVWIESFSLVFVEIYGFNLGLNGLAYMGVSTMILFSILNKLS